jgi:hypothetical protein
VSEAVEAGTRGAFQSERSAPLLGRRWPGPEISNGFWDKFERYIAKDRRNADLNRKALSAVAAKMAPVVHAVIKLPTLHRSGGAERENPVPAWP